MILVFNLLELLAGLEHRVTLSMLVCQRLIVHIDHANFLERFGVPRLKAHRLTANFSKACMMPIKHCLLLSLQRYVVLVSELYHLMIATLAVNDERGFTVDSFACLELVSALASVQ